jgi:hypothetical protein
MGRITIDSTLQNDLLEILVDQIPITETLVGRNSLLMGISGYDSWSRDYNNRSSDISQLIKYLQNTFTEEETLQHWGLTIFIDNACKRVKGSTAETNLLKIRERCQQQLSKQLQQLSAISSSDTLQNVTSSVCSLPFLGPFVQGDIPSQEKISQERIHGTFLETTACYLQIIRSEIDTASQPFTQLHLGSPEPSRKRAALQHLEAVIQHLLQFRDFIEKTLLPEVIATERHVFVDQTHFLVERTQSLIAAIIESNGAYQGISEKFILIRQEIAFFDDFDGRRPEF